MGKLLNMFYHLKLLCMTFSFVVSTAATDFVTINWNITTNGRNSNYERDYKYPMYEKIARAPCDLTTSCDAFCCEDPDCEENQVSLCSNSSYNCHGFLSFFDCNCYNFDKPEWLSLFCYVYKNPIYLGKFYKTQKKIDKLSNLKNIISKNSLFHHNKNKREVRAKPSNILASPMMTYVPSSESFPSVNPLLWKMPLKDSTYACTLAPVRYRKNGKATCLSEINQEKCQNGHSLGIQQFLVQNSKLSNNSDIPIVLKNSDFLEGLTTEVEIKCVQLKRKTVKLKNKILYFLEEENTRNCTYLVKAKANETLFSNNKCLNVLAFVNYQFMVNGSETLKLKVEYGLTNISFPTESNSNDYKNKNYIKIKYIYLKQKFSVNFFDVMNEFYDNKNSSSVDDIKYNRGYFIGEELNFGYKLVKNSSTSWKKGSLGVFGNDGSCDSFSPIIFGYNIFSVCSLRHVSNCTQLRCSIDEKFNALLRGDSLSVGAILRPPYTNIVPLLRSYENSSTENVDNITQCLIPVSQEIHILYTSVPAYTDTNTEKDTVLVHRIIGLRVNRVLQNVSSDTYRNPNILLTTRVFFSYISSSEEKPMSKFWTKMYSRELSDNSWLNIFTAFDETNYYEKEEITFWFTALVIAFVVFITHTETNTNLVLSQMFYRKKNETVNRLQRKLNES